MHGGGVTGDYRRGRRGLGNNRTNDILQMVFFVWYVQVSILIIIIIERGVAITWAHIAVLTPPVPGSMHVFPLNTNNKTAHLVIFSLYDKQKIIFWNFVIISQALSGHACWQVSLTLKTATGFKLKAKPKYLKIPVSQTIGTNLNLESFQTSKVH